MLGITGAIWMMTGAALVSASRLELLGLVFLFAGVGMTWYGFRDLLGEKPRLRTLDDRLRDFF